MRCKLRLSREGLKQETDWQQIAIVLPQFNLEKMISATKNTPTWVHFGAGNIFRGYIASLQQELLDAGHADTGIIAVEAFDSEIIDKIYAPYDNLSLLVLMNPDGSHENKVVASIAEGLVGDASRNNDWQRLRCVFTEPSLQMASFTITEKGYSLTNMLGELLPDAAFDMEHGPQNPRHILAKTASLAYIRYQSGALPIAFVSMDNCSHNGEKLRSAVVTIAQNWLEKGLVEREFIEYLNNPAKVSFPWSMIDKITPRPSEAVKNALSQLGLEDMGITCTDKRTYIAPFVNAEVPQYLVIEDHFPNGRMSLEYAGVLFSDRETVEKVERMKVTTCLNPLHTALAVFGCILGYDSIADEMKDESLKRLVEKVGYDEGMPVVVDSGILDPKAFIHEVIERRLPNPYIPDTPQRIVSDTSQKIGIRFGETIKAYVARPDLDAKTLKYIPFVIAGWCRYLMGVDDNGDTMDLSFDPMLNELTKHVSGIVLGSVSSYEDNLRPILSNEKLFGVNLYDIGLGWKVETYFKEMISDKGAVRDALQRHLT